MSALPRSQYGSTFSLDGAGGAAAPTAATSNSMSSPQRHTSSHGSAVAGTTGTAAGATAAAAATFRPTPLKAFTVAVSAVPAAQLPRRTAGNAASSSAATGAAAGASAGGAAAGPAFRSGGGAPLSNASFATLSSASFAMTKSFDDVFARRRLAAGGAGGGLDGGVGSGSMTGASTAAMAAAAAALAGGHGDASAAGPEDAVPVPESCDTYRVHLLLPPPAPSTSAATPRLSQSPHPASVDDLCPATAALEVLRTPKPQQVVQLNERWVRFQQLVRFVLSVAPRFEPPSTPPGFDFPVDLGLSFVQNSSIFAAAAVAEAPHAMTGSALRDGCVDDRIVPAAEREARRSYMEAYLNLALQCEQVSCLQEVQAFVGYPVLVQNELARFRATRQSASSPASTSGSGAGALSVAMMESVHGAGRDRASRHAATTASGPLRPPSSSVSASSHAAAAAAARPRTPSEDGQHAAHASGRSTSRATSTGVADGSPPLLAQSPTPPTMPSSSPSVLMQVTESGGVAHVSPAGGHPLNSPGEPLASLPRTQLSSSSGSGGGTVGTALVSSAGGATGLGGSGSRDTRASRAASTDLKSPPLASSHAPQPPPMQMLPTVQLIGGDAGWHRASSLTSSHSLGSSTASSASGHRESRQRHHRRRRTPRPHRTGSDGGAEGSGKNESAAAAAAPSAAAAAAAASLVPQPVRRGESSAALVPIAAETERMLLECFRMMDVPGRGYVTAQDCHVFLLCATPGTFNEVLQLITAAAEAAVPASQLESMLPRWMAECDGVVLGSPSYLISSVRFVEAVRQVLAASDAVARHTAAVWAAQGRASLSIRGSASSHWSGPGSPSPLLGTHTGAAAAAESWGAAMASLNGAHAAAAFPRESTAQPQLHHAVSQLGSFTVSSQPSVADAAAERGPHTAAPPPPVPSLEMWIDNYWLLLYAQLFTAAAALVVGIEAATLRATLLSVRARSHEAVRQQWSDAAAGAAAVGKATTQHSARRGADGEEVSVDRASAAGSHHTLHATSTPNLAHASEVAGCPASIVEAVAQALVAQPPVLGGFDVTELTCLLYVISESRLRIVSLEDVVRWLATTDGAPRLQCSLDEFATLLDALSCTLPFCDVLRCVRREATATGEETTETAGGLAAHADGAPPASDGARAWLTLSQQHTRLLRLVARVVAADAAGGAEFSQLVAQHRWRRAAAHAKPGVASGDGAGLHGQGALAACPQCHVSGEAVEAQAVAVAQLQAENTALRQQLEALKRAAEDAGVGRAEHSTSLPGDRASRHSWDVTVPGSHALTEAAAADVSAGDGFAGSAPRAAQPAASSGHRAGSRRDACEAPAAPSALCHRRPHGGLPAVMTSDAPSASSAHARATAVELVPVFTADPPGGAGAVADAQALRHASRAERAALTHVTRPGPLLYTVPSPPPTRRGRTADASRDAASGAAAVPSPSPPPMPAELSFSFYVCRDGLSDGRDVRRTAGGGGAGGGAAGAAAGGRSRHAAPVERLTLRDGAGRRVLALKLAHGVLHVLGSDTGQAASRCLPRSLSSVSITSALRPQSSERGTLTGLRYAPRSHAAAHAGGYVEAGSAWYDAGIDGCRPQNILYPRYVGSDPHGGAWAAAAAQVVPLAPWSTADAAAAAPTTTTTAAVGGRRWGSTAPGSAAADDDGEAAPLQRRTCRAAVQTRVWYTASLAFDWPQRRVHVRVGLAATEAPSAASSAEDAGGVCVDAELGMLDGAAIDGLATLDVYPRQSMLVAYCNVVARFS